ncbi:bifunctional acetate--CoA ligase family protein/GNAT family N-acetyltransferase [Candidatus Contendibacter odensensis]|uniref:Acetyltransferase n=1 Tax=Candidatus Contendobacter odensis Run_B_J11 TaxID=1400861 RepID=A0A7U7G7J9_9GAMM|nr:GNAT family N-acetyltransferase [Candidatus Contendobacter odensis]CDH43189.1 putative Acetyltransferase [Candidatus Contendobacter odensis Run_B_J11]
MPTRLLHSFCKPTSVALIGASERPGSIGAALTRNLLSGGFQGELFLVSRRHRRIQNLPAWSHVADLSGVPDLAIIATPPPTVPKLLAELGRRGTRIALLVTTAGPGDGTPAQTWRDAAHAHGLRLLGPGSFGVIAPHHRLNASLSSIFPQPGPLALVASSGMVLTPLLEWATAQGIGFSSVIALGNGSDVGFSDVLDELAYDPDTQAILLVLETLTHARSFLSAAHAAARIKPVLVVRAGRDGDAFSRQTDAVYAAAFRRAGILQLQSLRELLGVAETLILDLPVKGNRLAILGNSRELGLLAADTLMMKGGRLASFSPATQAALREILPLGAASEPPLDLGFDAGSARFAAVLSIALRESEIDAVLVLYAPNALVSAIETAAALIETFERTRAGVQPGLLTCWLGADSVREARQRCLEQRIPSYDTPDDAVHAFIQRWRHQRNRIALMETPPDAPELCSADVAVARPLIQTVLAAHRNELTAAETQTLLAAYGIELARAGVTPLSRSQPAPLELMIRLIHDPVFGSALWFGPGGSMTLPDEFAVALPPLNQVLAREAVAHTRVGQRLQSANSAADLLNDFALLLVKVAQLITDWGEVTTLELSPIFAMKDGFTVGAARIGVTVTSEPAHRRLAIRPYPRELEETLLLPDGSTLLIRPVRPEDEPALIAGFAKLSREEIRMRFMHIVKELTHVDAARLTQIDYDREMALVALHRRDGQTWQGWGIARIVGDSDWDRAEFAIVLLREAVGIGLGSLLLRRLIGYARAQGIHELFGEILRENKPMLELCRALGFTVKPCPDDQEVMIATLRLS